ncbi:muellerian-inhibiting factor isoform 1-T1 [Clarias gariepinus]
MVAMMCFCLMLLLPVTVFTGPASPTLSPSHHLLQDVPCIEEKQKRHPDAPCEDFLTLQNVWRKDGDLVKQGLAQFGFCTHDPEQVSSLTMQMEQKENGPECLHSKSEHWGVDEDGTFTLTLHFAKPGTYEQTTLASMMLLFFIESYNTDELKITFSSHVLQPNNQMVCISQATRFLVLRGVQPESSSHENIQLRMEVQHDSGKKIGLSEFQTIMNKRNSRSKSPVVLLFPKKSDNHSNGTFLFLCELQKFLNEVSPQGNPLPVQDEVVAISPSVLHSLPSLPLGRFSSESLLHELVNSSSTVLFHFPDQSLELRSNRVELDLKPSLLSVLKLKLDEALAKVQMEDVGRGAMDKLQTLSVLSALPDDGAEPGTGLENQREVQYRALLLLKGLQAVLNAWAVERAQRAARAGQQEPARINHCHLESFTVSLEKYLLDPATANINNCEGACGFPLFSGNNHAILLNSHLQSGQPLNRPLCCVPVAYEDLCVIEVHRDSTLVSYKTNMVAKECGCR